MGCRKLQYYFSDGANSDYHRASGTIPNRFVFRFSSEYHDSETNLVYYNYRYYSPELGRWLSRDPIGELVFYENYIKTIKDTKKIKALYQQSLMHPYQFTNDSPTNNFDEFGLGFWDWLETVIEASPVIGTGLNLFVNPPGSDVQDYEECKGCNPDCERCVRQLEINYVGRYMTSFLTHGAGDVTMIVGGTASAKLSAGMSLAFVVVGEVDSIVNSYAYIDNVEEIWGVAVEAKSKYCRNKQ